MSQSLTDRYDERIAGVLSCYDRAVITGPLPGVCYADGMTWYLNAACSDALRHVGAVIDSTHTVLDAAADCLHSSASPNPFSTMSAPGRPARWRCRAQCHWLIR
jgi:hypothetical protein